MTAALHFGLRARRMSACVEPSASCWAPIRFRGVIEVVERLQSLGGISMRTCKTPKDSSASVQPAPPEVLSLPRGTHTPGGPPTARRPSLCAERFSRGPGRFSLHAFVKQQRDLSGCFSKPSGGLSDPDSAQMGPFNVDGDPVRRRRTGTREVVCQPCRGLWSRCGAQGHRVPLRPFKAGCRRRPANDHHDVAARVPRGEARTPPFAD
jgi:hypothetical protein